MKDILDWIFEDSDKIIIWSVERLSISSYKKIDIEFAYKKWLSFSFLKELYWLESTLEMYYYQDRYLVLDTYYKYKFICDNNGIEINYFVNIDEFFEKMNTKHSGRNDRKWKKWYIYLIKSWDYYKIWKTIDIKKRVKRYITENPNEIELIHSFESLDYDRQELELHHKFKSKNHNREWFILNADDILFFKTL